MPDLNVLSVREAAVLMIIFGGIGGLINALLFGDKGIALPSKADVNGYTVIKIGIFANIFVGMAAAFVFWGASNDWSEAPLFGTPEGSAPGSMWAVLRMGTVVSAFVAGIAGANWLTMYVDKSNFKTAAVAASAADGNQTVATKMESASSEKAVELASSIQSRPAEV